MKPAPFEYFAPETLEEALALLARYGDDAKPLAGGQCLIPVLNFRLARPAVLIDLNRIASLAGIQATRDGLRIGAMTRQREAERSALIAQAAPLLAEALPHVAHPQIRNRGTLGGSLAHADPAAELPAVALALDAMFRLRSARGERRLEARDFFTGLFATVLASDELLVEIDVPALPAGTAIAFEEIARRHGDYALLGVAAVVALDSAGVCRDARLAYVNAGPGPQRAPTAEAALVGRRPDARSIDECAQAALSDLRPSADVHASVEYRRQLARVLTMRALNRALTENSWGGEGGG
ncbi:MAG: FAD binding domain-containing protein [Longimicrobiales bacterium]